MSSTLQMYTALRLDGSAPVKSQFSTFGISVCRCLSLVVLSHSACHVHTRMWLSFPIIAPSKICSLLLRCGFLQVRYILLSLVLIMK